MTARQRATLRGEGGSVIDRGLELIVIGGLARIWFALWLAAYPRARTVVEWTFYDELVTVEGGARWRRALRFMAHLPQFASAQNEAESTPPTQTSGEPPDAARRPNGAGASGGVLEVAGRILLYAVMVVFALLAVVMWINVIDRMGEMLDRFGQVRVAEVVALGLMLVVAMTPIVLIHQRRWFRWTRRESQLGESLGAHAVWRVAVILFGAIALVMWGMVMGEYFDVLGEGPARAALSDTSAKALMALIASLPLIYVVRRRHWVDGRDTASLAT